MTTITPTTHDHRIGLRRAAATGAASLLLLFVLCWIGARLDVPVTHLGIQAFTFAPWIPPRRSWKAAAGRWWSAPSPASS
jgi:hypothetical protein